MGHASGQLLPAENVLSEEDGTVIFMHGKWLAVWKTTTNRLLFHVSSILNDPVEYEFQGSCGCRAPHPSLAGEFD